MSGGTNKGKRLAVYKFTEPDGRVTTRRTLLASGARAVVSFGWNSRGAYYFLLSIRDIDEATRFGRHGGIEYVEAVRVA